MSFLIYPREGDPMSGSGKAGNGRGNNRKRPFRRRQENNNSTENPNRNAYAQDRKKSGRPAFPKPHDRPSEYQAKARPDHPKFERLKWVPPRLNTDPLPVPDCPYCGKPIRDISSAIADRDTGVPVHFDCVAERISGSERLENGDSLVYIGGGRFGVINFGPAGFRIKKIIEWENLDNRAEWRSLVCEHYSVT
jgi:hypothetical protein